MPAAPWIRAIELERRSVASLPAQVYVALRRAILDGRLPAGARLPSTRALAAALRIARNGVVEAYEQLLAEGFVHSRTGSGARVAPRLVAPRIPTPAQAVPPRLTAAARRAAEVPQRLSPWQGPLRPFRLGSPALDLAPLAAWGRLLRSVTLGARSSALDYGDELGVPELREALAERLYRTRAMVCSPEQIAITVGSQQALDLVSRLLVEPGDVVCCEDPLYHGARGAFGMAGARIVPVPVDAEGIDLRNTPNVAMRRGGGGGARAAPRLVYVTPSHQFPTGVTMTLERRLALLEWARRTGAFVVEDDYDSDFTYEGRPLAALYGLCEDSRVLYVGTFSKALFPAMRLGFLVLPPALVEPCRAVRRFIDGFPPTLVQEAAARLLTEGHLDRHLRRAVAKCRTRRDALVVAAERHLGELCTIAPPRAGLHAVAWLPGGVDDRTAAERAASAGVDTIPISAFARTPRVRGALILGFAAFQSREIETAVRRLEEVLRALV